MLNGGVTFMISEGEVGPWLGAGFYFLDYAYWITYISPGQFQT
jgi:hypothetical protein